MADWPSLLRGPHDPDALDEWFTRIADRLLNGSRLIAGQQTYRLVEVEFYYWSDAHSDPFTHRDPIQFLIGHWYFHRSRGTYRGGSFKGLDLTFGDPTSSGGILIRGLETRDGTLIDGPSLCVDHLLDATGAADVSSLDRAIAGRLAWDDGNPLLLRPTEKSEGRRIYRSARVGLFLKRAGSRTESTRFVMRPYRYLTEPRRTKKGKLHLVLALYARGESLDDIRRLTNCPRRTVERYVTEFEAGRKEADFTPYFGIDLGPGELCRLHGVWWAHDHA
jgi:3-methyladenine DNA glycosylase Mpg